MIEELQICPICKDLTVRFIMTVGLSRERNDYHVSSAWYCTKCHECFKVDPESGDLKKIKCPFI